MRYLVKDGGIFSDIANSLSDDGKNSVVYCTPWQTMYPCFKDHAIGLNLDHLQKNDKNGNPLLFWNEVEKADCICNFDVHANDEIGFLRKIYPEKSIWGSGRGEVIEADRIFLKKYIEAAGLDQMPYEVIKGMKALKAYIKTNPDKYVKVNIFRGDMESFHAESMEDNRADFLKIELALGPAAEETLFIVESPIKTDVEIGYDGFFNGVNYADKCFVGVEYHKNLYIAKVMDYEDIPSPIYDTMEAFAPLLQRMDYRGAISTEEKIVSQREHYLLDICSRLPSPLSALYPIFIRNWAEFVYMTGKKQECPLDIKEKYVGAFALSSSRGNQEYLPIKIKPSDRDKIRFQSVTMYNDKYYGVKGNDIIATIVAGGDSKEEVIDKIKEYSKLVDAPGLDNDSVNGIESILGIFKNAEKVGIKI